MSRVLVLVAAIIFFRTFLIRPRPRSLTQTSPYMNSLDGLVSPQQLSSLMEELDRYNTEGPRSRATN